MDPSSAGVDPDFGGDSSAVQDQLEGVQQIQAIQWGICCDPGRWIRRWPGVMQTLWRWQFGRFKISWRVVQQIQATRWAFAAILEDGSVVSMGWCRPWRWQFGSSRSASWDVQQIQATTWGLCCDPGRWIRRDLGLGAALWRWQFGSSRSP